MALKREIWNKKRVFVIRDPKGKIISWKYVKGSKLTLPKALSKFKNDGTLADNIKQSRIRLTNVTEIEKTQQSSFTVQNDQVKLKPLLTNISVPDQKVVQYVVKGTLNDNSELVARSKRLIGFSSSNKSDARDEAWRNFFARLAQAHSLSYDADEGEAVFEKSVQSVREGFVYYR